MKPASVRVFACTVSFVCLSPAGQSGRTPGGNRNGKSARRHAGVRAGHRPGTIRRGCPFQWNGLPGGADGTAPDCFSRALPFAAFFVCSSFMRRFTAGPNPAGVRLRAS